MAESGSNSAPRPAEPAAASQVIVAAALAWLVPGLGLVYLKRWRRGLLFFVVIAAAIAVGCLLHGNLYRPIAGQFLSYLGTFGAMGMGIPYFALRYGFGYEGRLDAPGFEYGTAFLLTAGLMNLLLVLDAWDIASGRKE